MSDDDTKYIIVKFDKHLKVKEVWHEYKDNNGNDKKDEIKEKQKFKIDFDVIHDMTDVTLIRGDRDGEDPYCIKVGKKLYCFP